MIKENHTMIKLGVNSVLFKKYDFATAAKAIKTAGYDGVEISGIGGMCEHLNLETWKKDKLNLRAISDGLELPFLSTEIASLDRERLLKAFEACAEIGIPVVNVGPGGKSDDEETLKQSLETLASRAEDAAQFGVTLCCKAHVGSAVYNTPTTLRMMEAVQSPYFGVDMDPSHIFRAGENPAVALPQVISRMKHIHIRDCKGAGPSPNTPQLQACGRGDIDLYGYLKAVVDNDYDGPVCLEVIGPDQELADAATIAAESYGYMNAILKSLGRTQHVVKGR